MHTTWSLITVTYNSAPALERYWRHELPQGVEWIVVDNGSADGSADLARRLGATVVALQENRGFSAANNEGLRAATGDYIAFVNPDVRVAFGTLDELAAVIDRTDGLVGPQLEYDDGTPQPNGRGAPVLSRKIRNRLSSHAGENSYLLYAVPGEIRHVFWVIGAAIAGRATLIREIGGWDDHFFVYYEDKDICIRAWKAGHPVSLAGSIRWTHGWARETLGLRLKPWIREIASLTKFYRRYPELLLGGRRVIRNHTAASARSGTRVAA